MIIKAGYDIYQECLRRLKIALLMGEADGKPVNSPSAALLTSKIRRFYEVWDHLQPKPAPLLQLSVIDCFIDTIG
jgi:hypothetical protein